MALTKEQIKEFKEEEKNASEFYEYRKIGSDLVEAGDKQWAKKLYKKAEDTAENSEDLFILAECVLEELSETEWAKNLYKKAEQDAETFEEFRLLGDSLCDYLKDKNWAKKAYMKAENLAENDEELTDLSGSVSEYLGDEKWAKKIVPDNTDNALSSLSNDEFSRYSKLNPVKIQASYLVWAYEKEMGRFTVNPKNGKKEEVEGYRIWEGKSSVDLTWNLPESRKGALKTLKKKNWKDKDIAYDDFGDWKV